MSEYDRGFWDGVRTVIAAALIIAILVSIGIYIGVNL